MGAPLPGPPDEWKDRVLKLIPAEVVTFYLAAAGIINAAADKPAAGAASYLFVVFLLGLVGTPAYLYRVAGKENPPPAAKQYVLTTAAFAVWALASTTPLAAIGVQVPPLAGALLLPTFTFVAGML